MRQTGIWATLAFALAFYGCGDDDSSTDSGMTTDAAQQDVGVATDLGALADSGAPTDSGAPRDTGTRVDTGTSVDVGVQVDESLPCECTRGDVCCDASCQFRPVTYECSLVAVYSCQGAGGCGATLEFNSDRTSCSGSSGQCDGATSSGTPATMNCGAGNRCVPQTITDGDTSGFGTTFGCVPDSSC